MDSPQRIRRRPRQVLQRPFLFALTTPTMLFRSRAVRALKSGNVGDCLRHCSTTSLARRYLARWSGETLQQPNSRTVPHRILLAHSVLHSERCLGRPPIRLRCASPLLGRVIRNPRAFRRVVRWRGTFGCLVSPNPDPISLTSCGQTVSTPIDALRFHAPLLAPSRDTELHVRLAQLRARTDLRILTVMESPLTLADRGCDARLGPSLTRRRKRRERTQPCFCK